MRSLFDINELSPAEIDTLIETANDMMANPAKYLLFKALRLDTTLAKIWANYSI